MVVITGPATPFREIHRPPCAPPSRPVRLSVLRSWRRCAGEEGAWVAPGRTAKSRPVVRTGPPVIWKASAAAATPTEPIVVRDFVMVFELAGTRELDEQRREELRRTVAGGLSQAIQQEANQYIFDDDRFVDNFNEVYSRAVLGQ